VITELEALRSEMSRIGLTSNQQHEFELDIPKARSAIAAAVDAGAFNPAAYSIIAFRKATKEHTPKAQKSNLHGLTDPLYTDDGERIWQWYEVDDIWRRGYLDDCWKALREDREPAARYQPSDDEFTELKGLSGRMDMQPERIRSTAEVALRAWGMLWFGDPEIAA